MEVLGEANLALIVLKFEAVLKLIAIIVTAVSWSVAGQRRITKFSYMKTLK